MKRTLYCVFVCAAISGCLEPLVDDSVATNSLGFPTASEVPSVSTDHALSAQIQDADGVDGLVPRISAFAGGKRVFYWDFGLAPQETSPLFYLSDADLNKLPEHPPIFDTVPGQPGYSPFWTVSLLPVTAAYAGERITSFAEVQRAIDAGLLSAPVETEIISNCPVVHPDVRLEVADGEPRAPIEAYYRGVRVHVFGFSPTPEEDGLVPVADVYALRREGGEPLHEGARRVDMTGDGDTNDTNGIFEMGADTTDYTPLWRVVQVVVPADYQSIDSFSDETQADYKSREDMFGPEGTLTPRADKIIAYEPTGMLVNCPIDDTVPDKSPEESP